MASTAAAPHDGAAAAGPSTSNSHSSSSTQSQDPCAAAALDMALQRLVECLTPTPEAWARRQQYVNDHIECLQQSWRCSHPIRISPFGSSLSGLCLADSDIDLGLFGKMHGCELLALAPNQAKKLLYQVLGGVTRGKLAVGQVEKVMGARVPVLKYKCALSGLDCDISIQGSGALVKANFMAVLNQHCPALSPLYRLVKLWAAAHDLNDASRSTFNSTSLLYLTIFYLQLQQLVPPLRELVEPTQLNDQTCRLLHPANKWLWDHPQHLYQLLGAAQVRANAWVAQQQQLRGAAWSHGGGLGQLLTGFFSFYAGLFTDWIVGRSRAVYADLWAGQLTSQRLPGEQLGKDYLFNLQDPFDPEDCPARAIGTMHKTNNGVGVLITYLITCSSKAIQRYHEPGSSSSKRSSSSSGSHSSSVGLRDRLCQCLGWLFGPTAVLYMADTMPRTALSSSDSTFWQEWAARPFDAELCAKLQQHQAKMARQHEEHSRGQRGRSGQHHHHHVETPASIFRWLVSALGAALEPEQGPCVLCLQHLPLLNKRIEAGALQTGLGAALAAGAAERRVEEQQRQAQLEVVRRDWQQQRLPGPPLPQFDPLLFLIQQQLAGILQQQRWQPRNDGRRRNPDNHPKVVKEAVRDAITQVARRMQDIGGTNSSSNGSSSAQHHQDGAAAAGLLDLQLDDGWQEVPHHHGHDNGSAAAAAGSGGAGVAAAADAGTEAEGIGGFGLQAVLEQHGFIELLDRYHFVEDGVLWPKLLPLREQLCQQQPQQHTAAAGGGGRASSSGGGGGGIATAIAAAWFEDHGHAEVASNSHSHHHHEQHHQQQHHHQPQPPQPQQQQQQQAVGTGVFLARILQEQKQRQQQQLQGVELQLELTAHRSSAGLVSSSVSVSGLAADVQQLTLDVDMTTLAAAAAASSSSSSHVHGRSHQQQHQQQNHHHHEQQQQHAAGSSAAVRVVPRPSRRTHPQPPHSPVVGTAAVSSSSSAAAAAAAAVPIDILPAPPASSSTQHQAVVTQAVAMHGTVAMHGDALAERYCRTLQEHISSPPKAGGGAGSNAAAAAAAAAALQGNTAKKPSGRRQDIVRQQRLERALREQQQQAQLEGQEEQQQQQQGEHSTQLPTGVLLGLVPPGAAAGGSSSSAGGGGRGAEGRVGGRGASAAAAGRGAGRVGRAAQQPLPAPQHQHRQEAAAAASAAGRGLGSSSRAGGAASSAPPHALQKQLQHAQNRMRDIKSKVLQKEGELQYCRKAVADLGGYQPGGEAAVAAGDRSKYLEAKARIHSLETSLKAQRENLELAQQHVADARAALGKAETGTAATAAATSANALRQR